MENIIAMGIDVGSGNTKGESCIFSSGVNKLPGRPAVMNKCICWGGNYYAVDQPKMDVQRDKFSNENGLVVTMAALALDMKKQGINSAKVRLGVGVPLTRIGIEAKTYKQYMLEHRRLDFTYEDEHFFVEISSVDVFPQGYAGVANMLDEFPISTVIVDMGSWTVDVMPLNEGVPDTSSSKSLNKGTIPCMININEILRQKLGADVPVIYLKEIMIKGTSDISEKYLDIIKQEIEKYVHEIMNMLDTLGFNTEVTRLVFIGGGATLIKNYWPVQNNIQIIDDVNINAKGYKNLIKAKYEIEE